MKYALVIADTEGANLREPLSDKVSKLLHFEDSLSLVCKEGEGLKHLAIGCYIVSLTSSTRHLEHVLGSARKSGIFLHVFFLEEEPSWITSE